jgi:hypothetical protein
MIGAPILEFFVGDTQKTGKKRCLDEKQESPVENHQPDADSDLVFLAENQFMTGTYQIETFDNNGGQNKPSKHDP